MYLRYYPCELEYFCVVVYHRPDVVLHTFGVGLKKLFFTLRNGSLRLRHWSWEKNKERIITARKRSLRRLCFHRCLSVHRGGMCGGGCGMGCAWWGGMLARGHACQGRVWRGACVAGETATTAADVTHPTGMLSCLKYFSMWYRRLNLDWKQPVTFRVYLSQWLRIYLNVLPWQHILLCS